MARDPQVLVYVGIKDAVVALDDRTGAEVWRKTLRSSDYVTVLWDGVALIAANVGEVWRLDAVTGDVIWHNELKGMGRGIVSLASSRYPNAAATEDSAVERRRQEAAAAASVP